MEGKDNVPLATPATRGMKPDRFDWGVRAHGSMRTDLTQVMHRRDRDNVVIDPCLRRPIPPLAAVSGALAIWTACAAPAPAGGEVRAPLLPPTPFSAAPTTTELSLVHLSDSEAGLVAHADTHSGGIARAAAVIDALRARAGEHHVVVSAGDLFIPSPELSLELDGKSAVFTRNNNLSLQVSVLGNHELDLGEQFLADAIAQMSFPYVTATVNVVGGPLAKVVYRIEDETPWASDVHGKLVARVKLCAGTLEHSGAGRVCRGSRVGVIGATTEELRLISGGATKNLEMPADINGVRDAVQGHVTALTREGINTIILLSHLQSAARELELVRTGLTGVDVIVSGGGENRLAAVHHRLLPGHTPDALCGAEPTGQDCYPITRVAADGKPVLLVATGGDLDYVGHLRVRLDAAGVLTGVDHTRSRPWPVDDTSVRELNADIRSDLVGFEKRTHDALLPLLQELAPSAVFFDGEREAVRNRETNLGNLSADAIHRAARDAASRVEPATTHANDAPLPLLALRNGGGIRTSIGTIDPKSGARTPTPIRMLDLKNALRFDSPIVVVTTTHAGLKRTLESALRGAGTARGHFPQVSANVTLRYTTDLPEQTHILEEGRIARLSCAGARVRDLTVHRDDGVMLPIVIDGTVSTPNASITVATLEYLAKGGDGWFPTESVTYAPLPGVTEQSSLRAFLAHEISAGTWRDGANYAPADAQRTRAVAMPNNATFPSCP